MYSIKTRILTMTIGAIGSEPDYTAMAAKAGVTEDEILAKLNK